MNRSDQAIQFRDVSKDFFNGPDGKEPLSVLQSLTFSIGTGEFVVILGPSGCGKSTILNILAGFERQSSGQVTVSGSEVGRPSSEHGMVFQEDSLFSWLTVKDNMLFGPRCRGVKPLPDVGAYLELVNLPGFEQFLPQQLSGGMKQRIALARLLINHPRLLLMDEPFGALDAQTREDMQELVVSVQMKYGPTVVFVTHDVDEAVFLADRILILSSRPAKLSAVIPVPATRPRNALWREDALFHRTVSEVRHALKKSM